MADYDRSEFFSNECVVCLIRFKYGIESISLLHSYVTSIIQHTNEFAKDQYKCFKTKYYFFSISNANTRRINTLYNESSENDCFLYKHNGCSINEIGKDHFDLGLGKRFVIELEFADTEAGDMRHIQLIAESFIAKKVLFQFRLFDSYCNGKYRPLSNSLYHQIRTFLLLGNTNNNLYFYSSYTKAGEESSQWQRLYATNLLKERIAEEAKKLAVERMPDDTRVRSAFVNIGHIFPLIPITEDMCIVLLNSDCQSDFGMDIIIDKYRSKVCTRITNIDEIIESDSCFEKLFFLATCAYLVDEDDISSFEIDKIIIIHERCVDYAQGIMQTVENAYIHAVTSRENKTLGCAALSLRIRRKSEAAYIKRNDSDYINNAEYFFEIHVADLLNEKEKFVGIVDQFIHNAQVRYRNSDETDRKKWIKTCGTPFEWKEKSCISLEDMFNGGEKKSIYWEYLRLPNVITYHYGLQIFNNIILANDGYLEVWSKKPYFANRKYYENKSDYSFWNGTIFTVFIPLHSETEISYADTVADSNYLNDLDEEPIKKDVFKYFERSLNLYNLKKSLIPGGKNQCVQAINNSIVPRIKKPTNSETIYIVDCFSITKKYHYELIAKAIFLLMANRNLAFNNVAFLNITNKYDVIKLFRQFALFYNREGRNPLMKNKSLYLVDVNAEMEIAFGGMITEVTTNVQDQLLIGGIGESTKKILYYLGGKYKK